MSSVGDGDPSLCNEWWSNHGGRDENELVSCADEAEFNPRCLGLGLVNSLSLTKAMIQKELKTERGRSETHTHFK